MYTSPLIGSALMAYEFAVDVLLYRVLQAPKGRSFVLSGLLWHFVSDGSKTAETIANPYVVVGTVVGVALVGVAVVGSLVGPGVGEQVGVGVGALATGVGAFGGSSVGAYDGIRVGDLDGGPGTIIHCALKF